MRAYAAGPYATALLKGDALSEAELDTVAQKMHDYTGLSVEYLKAANLRVSENAFTHELLKSQRKTIGRLDGRFVGPTWDPLEKEADYDPQSAAISAAYAAAFLDYYHGELKAGQGVTYHPTNFAIGEKWHWQHKTAHGEQPVVNTGVDLAEALIKDANFKVLVLNGYYDLATPFSATEYVMSHLGVPRDGGRARIDEVLRGRPHDVREPALDCQDEARPRRLHRRHRTGPRAARLQGGPGLHGARAAPGALPSLE